MLSQAVLKQYLHYNEDTGVFTWKIGNINHSIGDIAGSTCSKGRVSITVAGKRYLASRLAFLYMEGILPAEDILIDHRDTISTNNRWSNLRKATESQNHYNAKRSVRNTSGIKGVSLHKASGRWRADIQVAKTRKTIGYYLSKELAEEALVAYRVIAHGEFANHG